MNRRRYLFFDIDGTLLAGGYHDTYITESTILALEKCRKAGHFLCIATGRLQAMAVQDPFQYPDLPSCRSMLRHCYTIFQVRPLQLPAWEEVMLQQRDLQNPHFPIRMPM
jgi:hypothetical protein